MKRLILVGSVALMTLGAFAKEATLVTERAYASSGCWRDWTPVALTLCGPVGLPHGDWEVKGFQLGLINWTYQFSGLQLGVVNVAERAYGVQIGVVNVIATDDCPFLPVVNWSF